MPCGIPFCRVSADGARRTRGTTNRHLSSKYAECLSHILGIGLCRAPSAVLGKTVLPGLPRGCHVIGSLPSVILRALGLESLPSTFALTLGKHRCQAVPFVPTFPRLCHVSPLPSVTLGISINSAKDIVGSFCLFVY